MATAPSLASDRSLDLHQAFHSVKNLLGTLKDGSLAAILLGRMPTIKTGKRIIMEHIPIETSNDSDSEIILPAPQFTAESKETADRVILLRRPGIRSWASMGFVGLPVRLLAIAMVIALAGGAAAGGLIALGERQQQNITVSPPSADVEAIEAPPPAPQPTIEVNDQKISRPAVVSRPRRYSEPETPEARSMRVIRDVGRYLDR